MLCVWVREFESLTKPTLKPHYAQSNVTFSPNLRRSGPDNEQKIKTGGSIYPPLWISCGRRENHGRFIDEVYIIAISYNWKFNLCWMATPCLRRGIIKQDLCVILRMHGIKRNKSIYFGSSPFCLHRNTFHTQQSWRCFST